MDKPDKDGDKESIEEILSDLNSLLNRMPAILSDIKMPETQPVDFSRIRREAEEQPVKSPEPARESETVRLEPEEMAGIAASAHILPDPEPAPDPEPEPDLSGEEYNFDFAPEPPAAAEPVTEPVPAPASIPAPQAAEKTEDVFGQSGDFGVPDIDALLQLSASGEDAIRPAEENKEQGGEMEEKHQDDQDVPAEDNSGSLPAGETPPEQPAAEEPQPAQEQPAPEQPPQDQPPAFEATVKMDAPFEFPDPVQEQPAAEEPQPAQEQPSQDQPPALDATVKMDSPFEFQEPAAEQPAPEAKTAGAEESLPSGDDLKAFESAFVIPDTGSEQEPVSPSAEMPAEIPAGEAPVPELSSPEPQFPVPEQEPAERPEAAAPETAAPSADIQPGGISLEPQFPMPEEQPAPAAEQPAAAEEPQLSVGEPQLTVGAEPQLSVGSPEQQPEGISLEPRSDTPFESPIEAVTGAASSGESAEEKTVVFGPGQMPETPGGEETLVYQGGDPSSTSRMKAEASLPELAALEPPATVDKSRVKTLAFMYASGEEKFCADVIATLDAICLKSESRPMFIQRAFVKPCGDDMRGAMAQQMVSETGAAGLICVGSVSQEALYDIENAFGSSGSFFRHFSQDNFNMTSALDSVLDLILKP